MDEIQEWSRLLIHRGIHKSCLGSIELRPFLRHSDQPHALYFDDHLKIIFPFGDERTLEVSGWNRERFHGDKKKSLGRLSSSNGGLPRKIVLREEYESWVEIR